MIQANEIRIGNWVSFSPTIKKNTITSRMVQVKEIYQGSCATDDSGLPLVLFYNSESLKAAHLNRGILDKCAFGSTFSSDPQERNASKKYDFKSFAIHQPNENENYFIAEIIGDVFELKSVHQLQNLYFALTGEELQISFNPHQIENRK